MTQEGQGASRREFLEAGGKIAAASALAGVALPSVKPDANGRYPVPIPGVWTEI